MSVHSDIQIKSGKLESTGNMHIIKPLTRELLDLAIKDENKKTTYIHTETDGWETRRQGTSDTKIKEKFSDGILPEGKTVEIDHRYKLLFEDDKVFFCTNTDTGIFGKHSSKEQLFIYIPAVSSDRYLSKAERKAQAKSEKKSHKSHQSVSKKGGNKSKKNKSKKNK